MPACRRFAAAAVPLAAASSLALAACGGSSSPPSPDARASASASADDAALKFARCMRQHGVAFPDPSASRRETVQIKDPQAFRAADSACARYRPAGADKQPTPAQQAEFQDKALQFSRCMRSHGINLPDPQTSGNGGAVKVVGSGGPDPSSPAFQSAQKACESLLPKGGGIETFHADGPVRGKGGPSSSVSGGTGG